MRIPLIKLAGAAVALAACAVAPAALAQSNVRGYAFYTTGNYTNGKSTACGFSGCHGPVGNNIFNIRAGTNPSRILGAINSGTGGMGVLNNANMNFTQQDAADIAAYITNPNVEPIFTLVSPVPFDFGNLQVGNTSMPRTYTVTNSGVLPLMITNMTATNAAVFPYSNGCMGANLAAGQTCQFTVSFKPASGAPATSNITLTHNAAGSPSTLMVSGTGSVSALPAVSVAPPSISLIDAKSPPQRVTFKNTSATDSVKINGITISTGYTMVDAGTGACVVGQSVAANGNCVVDVKIDPQQPTVPPGTLTIASTGAGTTTVNLAMDSSSRTAGFVESTNIGAGAIQAPIGVLFGLLALAQRRRRRK